MRDRDDVVEPGRLIEKGPDRPGVDRVRWPGQILLAIPPRDLVRDPGSRLRLSEGERVLMAHVGAFRSVLSVDIERVGYPGDRERLRADVKRLARRGLIEERVSIDPGSGRTLQVLTLTRVGAELVRSEIADPRQAIYSGIARATELWHDSMVFRMYGIEAARIEYAGGRVRRVVLDYELSSAYQSAKQRARAAGSEQPRLGRHAGCVKAGVEVGLVAVDGYVQIPDVRVEYEPAAGNLARVDLELATAAYSREAVSRKARAGFRIYAVPHDAQRFAGRLPRSARDLPVEILTL